jgi:TonB family protein
MSTNKPTPYQGSIWQNLRWRVTGWFRPTHPRFALHLFLIALGSGLLLSFSWLAIHGIAQQFRHGAVIAGASAAGPGNPLPTPMAGGKAALSAAGAGRASSWTIQEGGQPAPDPATDTTAENDLVAPDLADGVNASADAPTPADESTAPHQEADPNAIPATPAPAESARIGQQRIGQQTEVTLSVQIDEQGRPIQVTVQRSSGSAAIDSAALLTVQNRHFPPVLRDGEPVPATLTVPVQMQTQAQDH